MRRCITTKPSRLTSACERPNESIEKYRKAVEISDNPGEDDANLLDKLLYHAQLAERGWSYGGGRQVNHGSRSDCWQVQAWHASFRASRSPPREIYAAACFACGALRRNTHLLVLCSDSLLEFNVDVCSAIEAAIDQRKLRFLPPQKKFDILFEQPIRLCSHSTSICVDSLISSSVGRHCSRCRNWPEQVLRELLLIWF